MPAANSCFRILLTICRSARGGLAVQGRVVAGTGEGQQAVSCTVRYEATCSLLHIFTVRLCGAVSASLTHIKPLSWCMGIIAVLLAIVCLKGR